MDAGRPSGEFCDLQAGATVGLDHFGIQVENQSELQEVYGRLQQADRPVLEEGATTCCYAQSEKAWIADPQGLAWETFLTTGESTVYGDSTDLGAIRMTPGHMTAGACCAPDISRGACCDAAPELAGGVLLLREGRSLSTITRPPQPGHHNPDCGSSRHVAGLAFRQRPE